MSDVISFAQALVRCRSVTPNDAGCQQLIAEELSPIGFHVKWLPFGPVLNSVMSIGEGVPRLAFVGHVDVVPAGDEAAWMHPPFSATQENGALYGRGIADMKGSVAAFTIAAKQFVQENPKFRGTLEIVLTSDEEGLGIDGIARIAQWMQEQNRVPNYCLVAEPTSELRFGDVVKNGRRGSFNANLRVLGVQGHVAYPHLAKNPIHAVLAVLDRLTRHKWDINVRPDGQGTQFQISNFNAGTGASNVIPSIASVSFNLRYSSEHTEEELVAYIEGALKDAGFRYEIDWISGGRKPFTTSAGNLAEVVLDAVETVAGVRPLFSQGGGTSDAAIMAQICPETLEFGPLNQTIHQVNEHLAVEELVQSVAVFKLVMSKLLAIQN